MKECFQINIFPWRSKNCLCFHFLVIWKYLAHYKQKPKLKPKYTKLTAKINKIQIHKNLH